MTAPASGSRTKRAFVVGAGLTGASAAYTLAGRGYRVTVFEATFAVGGHARSETVCGVPYEPNGAHLFHTSDVEVWHLVNSLVRMRPYEHRVMTTVEGQLFSWPIQVDEIDRLSMAGTITAELADLPPEPYGDDFETRCVTMMGPTLYGLFVEGYTSKQWGVPASKLSASIAPKRVELRTDGYRPLFRDPYQGYPMGGYGELAERLLERSHDVWFNTEVTLEDLPELTEPGAPVIVTAPLDGFFDFLYGPLEWRGVRLESRFQPLLKYRQPVMVVNHPSASVAYTRTIETKHVLGAEADLVPGTVVSYEYPGADAHHYPVPDVDGANARLQALYEERAGGWLRQPLIAAGRLGTYAYMNMDQAIRAGCDAAVRASST